MSKTNSRSKGARGEREFAEELRRSGIEARRGQQFSGLEGRDVISSVDRVHWEVKRTEKLRLWDALEQAQSDANESEIPIVAHRANRRPWVAILSIESLVVLLREAGRIPGASEALESDSNDSAAAEAAVTRKSP